MQLGELLGALIQQGDKSKNNIIKEIGIDRSSFYKILSGERRATDYQFVSLVRALRPGREDLEQLLDAYEREQAGESLYQQRNDVRGFINSLSDTPEEEPSMPDALRRYIMDAIQAGTDSYSAFLPIGSKSLAGLFALLNGDKVGAQVRVLFSIEEAADENENRDLMHALSRWFRYLRPQTMRFHAYTIWETTRGLEALPFPYYIMTGESILMISADGARFIEVRDPQMVTSYQENYEQQIARAEEIANTESGYEPILQFFAGLWQTSGEDAIYLLSPRPCLWLCSTDDMVRKYMHDEGFVQYGRLIRSLQIKEFTTESGLQQFLAESCIAEAGFHIPIAPEDLELVRARITGHKNLRTFFLDEERVHLPQDWQLFCVAHKVVVLVPYATSTYILVCTSGAVVEPLTEWCESRCKTFNNDIPML